MNDLFGNMFHDSRQSSPQDLTTKIELTFDEAVHGCKKTIHIQDSKGNVQSIEVKIPAGIDTGKKIRVKGKGSKGSYGRGDLYLEAIVGEKTGFERKGNDVYTVLNIPYTTAVLGGEIIVETLHGNVKCKVKAGTQSGSRIRLRGKGIPLMGVKNKKGDHYVTIQIAVPTNLSSDAKSKLQEYAKCI